MDQKDKRIHELEQLVKELLARIEELERRLALNSNNSSKPPSSDGLRKSSKNRSLREIGNKKFGGQVGHKGNTLNKTDSPDVTIQYDAEICNACGSSLSNIPVIETIDRQEVDVVIKKLVTEHKASIKVCCCGRKNVGIMPECMKALCNMAPMYVPCVFILPISL